METKSSASEPVRNDVPRVFAASRAMRVGAYFLAFLPVLCVGFVAGMAFSSPRATDDPAGPVFLCALVLFLVFLGWFVLHRAVARVELDAAHISTTSVLGLRRSLAVRDIVLDAIFLGAKGGESLVLRTAAGARLAISNMAFPDTALKAMRDDIAARVRQATGRDVPTQPPPPIVAEMRSLALFIVALPLFALIAIAVSAVMKKYGGP